MERADAEQFAAAWVEAWNSHDLDRILEHFSDDVEFTSPLVPLLTGGSNPVRGMDDLRAYWAEGLRRRPHLHFTLIDLYVGAGALAIRYHDERGRETTEMLVMGDDGRARRGWGLYGGDPAAAASS